jgi:hypothetical protein
LRDGWVLRRKNASSVSSLSLDMRCRERTGGGGFPFAFTTEDTNGNADSAGPGALRLLLWPRGPTRGDS